VRAPNEALVKWLTTYKCTLQGQQKQANNILHMEAAESKFHWLRIHESGLHSPTNSVKMEKMVGWYIKDKSRVIQLTSLVLTSHDISVCETKFPST